MKKIFILFFVLSCSSPQLAKKDITVCDQVNFIHNTDLVGGKAHINKDLSIFGRTYSASHNKNYLLKIDPDLDSIEKLKIESQIIDPEPPHCYRGRLEDENGEKTLYVKKAFYDYNWRS